MSSLFSDPPFVRGSSLLNKEPIELDYSGFPIAGREIAGSIKAFTDVNPGTGPAAVRNSNRVVYCMACRYVGITALNPADNGADTRKAYVIDRASPTGAQFRVVADAVDTQNGRMVGILDEYLSTEVRTNDIVWLVIGGPTSGRKTPNTTILNTYVEVGASGALGAGTTLANRIGAVADPSCTISIVTAAAAAAVSVNISTTIGNLALIAAGSVMIGSGITGGTKVSSVSNLSISGTSVTATLTVDTAFAGGVAVGTDTYQLTSQSHSDTSFRVSVDCNLT